MKSNALAWRLRVLPGEIKRFSLFFLFDVVLWTVLLTRDTFLDGNLRGGVLCTVVLARNTLIDGYQRLVHFWQYLLQPYLRQALVVSHRPVGPGLGQHSLRQNFGWLLRGSAVPCLASSEGDEACDCKLRPCIYV